jgi:hypothetical protein
MKFYVFIESEWVWLAEAIDNDGDVGHNDNDSSWISTTMMKHSVLKDVICGLAEQLSSRDS